MHSPRKQEVSGLFRTSIAMERDRKEALLASLPAYSRRQTRVGVEKDIAVRGDPV
jgi:hypothetical protein